MQEISRQAIDSDLQIIERADGTTEITGYAWRYYDGTPNTEYNLGSNRVERIKRGAFSKVDISETVLRWNHSRDYDLGNRNNGLVITDTEIGGRFSLPYDSTDPDHIKVRTKIKKGLARGCSFKGLAEMKWDRDGDTPVRWIERMDTLEDVSIVDKPAYRGCVAIVRSEQEQKEIDDDYSRHLQTEKQWEETHKRIAELEKIITSIDT